MRSWKLEIGNWKLEIGGTKASAPSGCEAPVIVILSEAKDLLFVCSQLETADASLCSA